MPYRRSYSNYLRSNDVTCLSKGLFPKTRAKMRDYFISLIKDNNFNIVETLIEFLVLANGRLNSFRIEIGEKKFQTLHKETDRFQPMVDFFNNNKLTEANTLIAIQKIFYPKCTGYHDFIGDIGLVNQYLDIETKNLPKVNSIDQKLDNIIDNINDIKNTTAQKLDNLIDKTTTIENTTAETQKTTNSILNILKTITKRKNLPYTTAGVVVFLFFTIFGFTKITSTANAENGETKYAKLEENSHFIYNPIELKFKKIKKDIIIESDKNIDLKLVTTTIYNTFYVYKLESDWAFAENIDSKGETMCEWGGAWRSNDCDRHSDFKCLAKDTIILNLSLSNEGINTYVVDQLQINILEHYTIDTELGAVKTSYSSNRDGGEEVDIKFTKNQTYNYPILNSPSVKNEDYYTFSIVIDGKDASWKGNIYRFNVKISGYDSKSPRERYSIISDKEYFLANY